MGPEEMVVSINQRLGNPGVAPPPRVVERPAPRAVPGWDDRPGGHPDGVADCDRRDRRHGNRGVGAAEDTWTPIHYYPVGPSQTDSRTPVLPLS